MAVFRDAFHELLEGFGVALAQLGHGRHLAQPMQRSNGLHIGLVADGIHIALACGIIDALVNIRHVVRPGHAAEHRAHDGVQAALFPSEIGRLHAIRHGRIHDLVRHITQQRPHQRARSHAIGQFAGCGKRDHAAQRAGDVGRKSGPGGIDHVAGFLHHRVIGVLRSHGRRHHHGLYAVRNVRPQRFHHRGAQPGLNGCATGQRSLDQHASGRTHGAQ